MFKSYGVVGGGGGPWDFSVSPSPFGLDFGTLDFGTSDSGLILHLCKMYFIKYTKTGTK